MPCLLEAVQLHHLKPERQQLLINGTVSREGVPDRGGWPLACSAPPPLLWTQQGRAQASWKQFSTTIFSLKADRLKLRGEVWRTWRRTREVKLDRTDVAYLTQDQRSASLPASRLHRMSVPVIADIVSPENVKNYEDFQQCWGSGSEAESGSACFWASRIWII